MQQDQHSLTARPKSQDLDTEGQIMDKFPVEPPCGNQTSGRSSHHGSEEIQLHIPASDSSPQTTNNPKNPNNQIKETPGIPSSKTSVQLKLVTWDGDHDPHNPKNMSTARKWLIVVTLASGTMCVTNTSSIYSATYRQMDLEFGTSRIVTTLGLTFFLLGLGISPLFLGPLSEFYGRRMIYIVGYVAFTIWLIPCAVAKNIQTMLVARFFGGFAASAFLAVAGGTVGDLFTKKTLLAPMMVYSASPFLGPGLGPVLGGFINYNVTWRWTYYFLLIWSGVELSLIVLIVPETYAPVLLRSKARRLRAETGDDTYKAQIEIMEKSVLRTVGKSLYRPFLILFLDPMCFSLCLFSALLLSILFLFLGAFQLVFSNVYGFNEWQVGAAFLGIAAGMVIATLTSPLWHRLYLHMLDEHEKRDGVQASEPEYRLPPSIVGSWLCCVGLFWFAWTIYPSVHWIVPIIGTAFFGMGTVLTFVGIFTFLVEAFPLFAASALSANTILRCVFAGAFPLFGDQMYNTLGYHWATTLIALLTLLMAPFPWIFYVYGKRLRAKSRFTETR